VYSRPRCGHPPTHSPPPGWAGGGGGGGTYAPAFLQRSDTRIVLCTGAFLYARYSFLLISYKFCDLTMLPWKGGGVGRAVRKENFTALEEWGGGCVRKHYCIVPRVRIRVKLKSHKKFNFYISTFLGPKWHSPDCSMPFYRAQKCLDFQGPTPSQMDCEKRPQVRIRCLQTTVLKVGDISFH
jgi:hypothetical protein